MATNINSTMTSVFPSIVISLSFYLNTDGIHQRLFATTKIGIQLRTAKKQHNKKR